MFHFDLDKILDQFAYHPESPLIFSSGLFLFLFLGFLLVYKLLQPHERLRILWCTIFSVYFYYKSSGIFFLLLVASVVVDFNLAKWIEQAKTKRSKTWLLVLSLVANLGMLVYFKYTNYFAELWNGATGMGIGPFDIFLPVGISFFTFQSLSYTIDVYRGQLKALDDIWDYAFFVTFFPQMVAGPIVRAADFLPQIHRPLWVSKEDFGRGIFLFCIGLFKKAVISDYISVNFVERVFESPQQYTGLENLMGVYGYALQIYCDFSGYTDMAIGIGLLLGFHFPINFDSPYQSLSITEFWRRWHISLSTWLRDYLYIPLGGSRGSSLGTWLFPGMFLAISFGAAVMAGVSMDEWVWLGLWSVVTVIMVLPPLLQRDRQALATNFNLFATMLLGGLWHGAATRFIIWGALHGLALSAERWVKAMIPGKHGGWRRTLGGLWTFHFVCFCWIFFRAENLDIANAMLRQIAFDFRPEIFPDFLEGYAPVVFWMALGFGLHLLPKSLELRAQDAVTALPLAGKAVLLTLFIALVMQVKSSDVQPFIYFQF
ncbi:MAG: Peptidoglycan O-acetyltransferase [Saprospiraceae bacterium]|nr:Peptidoglycan O-acetyltransferase [Saprospiraceae bacterium]